MKKLSYWGLLNPKKTIAILSVLHLLIAILVFYLGVLLFAEGVVLSKWLIYISIFFFVLVQIFYPIRHARHKLWKANYSRQKVMDVIIIAAYIVGVTANTNIEAYNAWKTMDTSSGYAKQIVFNPVVEDAKDTEKTSFWKKIKERKKLKKQFRKFIKKIKNSDNNQNKISGIILLLILLTIAVGALACVLACGDAGGLAVLLILGLYIFLMVLGVKAIRRLKGQKPDNYQPATDSD